MLLYNKLIKIYIKLIIKEGDCSKINVRADTGGKRMKSPYEVLGISPLSGEAEIKKAYKKLSAKYYSASDSVSLEKMEELNAAYDELILKKKSSVPSNEQHRTVSEFSDVRRLITDSRLSDAEEILDSVRSLARGGEWNYLKALILFKRGLMREASAYIERALEKDSLSSEFNSLYSKLKELDNPQSDHRGFSQLLKKLFKER